MKTLLSIVIVCAVCATAFAESIPYEFTTTDISVDGVLRNLRDINDDGMILTNTVNQAVIVKSALGKGKLKMTFISCIDAAVDTSATAINNNGEVVGSCSNPTRSGFASGFVRLRNGRRILLDYPGADHTIASGINDNGQIVGHYWNPLDGRSGLFRIHGFVWDKGKFSTLDFPLPNTYTTLSAINKSGKIIGRYVTFEAPSNLILAQRWFVYDNGSFLTADFPESLEYIGGPAFALSDINESGQIVVDRTNGGPEWNGVFIYRAGTFYEVQFPIGWIIPAGEGAGVIIPGSSFGINNKGQLVGNYQVQVGIDPFYGSPIYQRHGFVATPTSGEETRATISIKQPVSIQPR